MATNSIITNVTGTDTSSNRIASTFYGTCSDAATKTAKTVILADSCVFNDSCLVTGVTIHVKFTNSNAYAKPTLKVGTATAKPIMAYGTTYVGTTPGKSWYAGAVVSFTYDGTNWVMNDHSAIDAIISAIYPVGSIYMSVNNVDPGTYLTGTTWTVWGAGRVPVGVDILQTEFNTVEETGGDKTHTHNYGIQVGSYYASNSFEGNTHAGVISYSSNGSITVVPQSTVVGSYDATYNSSTTASTVVKSSSHRRGIGNTSYTSNLQPYITCYMWKRTA